MVSNASNRPRIGITTYLEQSQTGVWDVRASFLPKVYLDAIVEAGGVPVLLAPQPCDDGQAMIALGGVDGLILAGGADVDPRRYGHEPHEKTGAPREDRDAWELALLDAALARDMPIFGICRGLQIINTALGGTLEQHVPDIVGDLRYQPGPALFGSEAIEAEAGSALAGILGTERQRVPVYHHQAIREVAPGTRVTARTSDGVIEATEIDGATYGVAVQWHPEEQTDDRRLFVALVDAARAYAAKTVKEQV